MTRRPRVDALLADAQTPRRRVRRALRRQARRARRARPRSRRCTSSPRSRRSPAAPAPTRTSRSRSTPPSPAHGALLQRVEEKGTAIETALLFFHLEWAALDDARADELLATDGLDFARHHLATARRYRPHLLSEPEERILTEKALSGPLGVGAAVRGADRGDHGRARRGGRAGRAGGRARRGCSTPDREVRRDTAERVTEALQPGLRTRAYTFNTLLADKMTDDRLRAYPHWLAARNLSNEASDESVQALIEAVRGRYELPRRWYRLKAQLLGIDRLADYDRMAAVTQDTEKVGVARGQADRAGRLLRRSRGELGALVDRFFDERWIDGPVRPGQARRRVLLLRRAERAPVRDAQLHLPAPRRADAGARARARRARRAGLASRACSTWRRR